KFFKRRGRLVRQPRNVKKTLQRSQDDKNGKSDRKCFRCGDPNHLIGECPKLLKDKNQKAFVGGSWSDSGEEDDEKANDETCLVAQASNEVCSDSSYFSDENSSIDDFTLDNEYDKLCKTSLKIITNNKQLKAIRNSLENELSKLKLKLSTLEKNKGVDLECTNCQSLKIDNEKLKEEALKLTQFEKSTHCSNEMLSNQKPSSDKLGRGFNSFEASTSGTKKIKFVKSHNETPSRGGPSNAEGGPHKAQTPPKLRDRLSFSTIILRPKISMAGNAPDNLGFNLLSVRQICNSKCKVVFSENDSEIFKDDKVIGYSQNSKAYIILNKHTRKIKESLNVTFYETPPPSKTSPLVDDDIDEEEAFKVAEKKILSVVLGLPLS
ncbi:retrovirus-related pol polyprotein from transposon TNT 1-94, partial [Tanacetum coccineum]